MFLKSIELQGFKSFPDKTVLDFKDDITVIIGPNGSGKSNIADAMRWVLGEVSSRNIRGTKMEDVIFGGCDGRKPSSFAQVSLTLDNSSGEERLPVEYDTVTVTRRYFRGGDSDYMINGKACRLKDIHSLFMNTGIGKGGYSVIGQGKIAEIVSQKSEDRRIVFEEAAGIAKYKFSKNESVKKLDATRENLNRLNDLNSVLASRVGPLEKESEKARRYMELYEEKRKLDIALWLYDMTALSGKIASLRGTFEIFSSDLELTESEADKLSARTEELYEKEQALKREVDACNARLITLQNEKSEATNKKAFAEAQSENLKEKIKELAESVSSLSAQLDGAEKAVREREAAYNSAYSLGTELSARVDGAEQAYNTITEKIAQCAEAVTDADETLARLTGESIDLKIRLSVSDSTEQTDAEKRSDIDGALAMLFQSGEGLKKEYDAACADISRYECQRLAADEKAQTAQNALNANAETSRGQKQERDNADIAAQVAKRKLDTLLRMEELFEGYSKSTQFVMDEHKGGRLRGIFAPLSQLLTVPAEYTTAIECTLGASLQHIVVEDEASAKAALYALKQADAGRTTFLPLTTMRPYRINNDINIIRAMTGFKGVASDVISYDKKFENVILNLLGRTVIFDNIDNATACAKKIGFGIRLLTLDGQQINAGGSYTGGSRVRESGILSRSRETEALKATLNAENAKITAAEEKLKLLSLEASKLSSAYDSAAAERDIIAALQAEIKTGLKVTEAKQAELQTRINELRDEKAGISDKAEARRRRRLEDGEHLSALAVSIDGQKEQRAGLEEQMARMNTEQSELRAALEGARVRFAENNRDISSALSLLDEAKASKAFTSQKLSETRASLAYRSECLTKNTEESGTSDASIAKYDGLIAELTEKASSLRAEIIVTEEKYSSSRALEKEKNDQKESLIGKKIQAEAKLETAEAEREKLKTVLEDAYELTYTGAKEKAVEYGCPEVNETSRPSLAQHQNELKGRLRVIGHVNVGAIEEYKEVKEQHDALTLQIADLEKSSSELCEIISRLDEEMKTSFISAFENISLHFSEVFSRLFGGGTAYLSLKEPDNVLESGIDINVAPPGKIIKSLSLLSGGEQSFVAIAIYFALLEVNPTPFIMLDEIEAALDEVNVDRFAQYIKDTQNKTQFILISHRRGTMEAAEKLYGVTMPTKGISKVLSVDISEIEEKIGKLE